MTDVSNTETPKRAPNGTKAGKATAARLAEAEAAEAATEAAAVEIIVGDEFAELLSLTERRQVNFIPRGEGDKVGGVVKFRETMVTSFGPVVVTVLDTKPSDPSLPLVRWAWMGEVLKSAERRHNPQPGDLVAGRMGGKRMTEGGTFEYDDWRVVCIDGPDKVRTAAPTEVRPTKRPTSNGPTFDQARAAAADPNEPF